MANGTVTIDQFKEILMRLKKLEHRELGINKLEEDYHNLDKGQATTTTEIRALRREIDKMWKLQLFTLGIIIAMFGTLIAFLFKVFNVI